MKKILIIAYYFSPNSGAGVQRPLKFAKYLPNYGYAPVICCPDAKLMRHKKDYSFLKDIPPSAKVYNTFLLDLNWLFKLLYGVKLHSVVNWINNVILFPAYQLQWIPFLKITLKKILKKEQISAILITAPPHSNLVISKWLKKSYDIPIIFDLRDPFTFNLELKDQKTIEKRFSFEKSILNCADHVITVTPTVKKKMEEAFNLHNISFIPNGFDEDDFKTGNNLTTKKPNTLVISYIGKTYGEYTTIPFLIALNEIKDKLNNVEVRYIGSFTKNEIDFISSNKLDQIVKLIPYCSHDEAIAYNQESDILLLVIANDKWRYNISGKVFEYMRSGKPILAIIPEYGDSASILKETATANLIVSPDRLTRNPELLLQSFNNVRNYKPNQNAIAKYSRKELTKNLVQIIDPLVSK
ncbi:glycosyltransferase [uncultured Draconibacterium sp.]|uniref:glycosyltransferase n=1 Tax=uncultured Draconibacterium sp. TaxID=1573823 RepID=UPI0029C8A416|nr:glycosyltransferase [uncultured Draconibacterium sp.]